MITKTYSDYLLGILRSKLYGTWNGEEPLAEWEWELLFNCAPYVAPAPVEDESRFGEVTLFARLTNGTVVRFDGVHIDSWRHADGMLTFEVDFGDEIHYVPNVVSWHTVA